MQINASFQSTQPFFENPHNPLDHLPTQHLADAHPGHTKWAILTLWENGTFSANEAIFWLIVTRTIGSDWVIPWPNEFLRSFIALERSRAEGGVA